MYRGRAWVVCRSCRCNAGMVSGSPSARRTHARRMCRGRAEMVPGSPTARRTLARRTYRGRAGMVPRSRGDGVRLAFGSPDTRPENYRCRGAASRAATSHHQPPEWPLPAPHSRIDRGKTPMAPENHHLKPPNTIH